LDENDGEIASFTYTSVLEHFSQLFHWSRAGSIRRSSPFGPLKFSKARPGQVHAILASTTALHRAPVWISRHRTRFDDIMPAFSYSWKGVRCWAVPPR
jgi:hypothetical protein